MTERRSIRWRFRHRTSARRCASAAWAASGYTSSGASWTRWPTTAPASAIDSCSGSVSRHERGRIKMDLREEKVGGVTVVEVKGRIDSTTAPALGARLTASLVAPKVRVLLDLSRLEYISSAGFRILLLAAKRAGEAVSPFVLRGVSGQ